ncbi:unnamed protein product, partial [Hapterophycus canaliculatus]
RAEFDTLLKKVTETMGIPILSTASEIFALFDDAGEGILHVRQMAAGLAVLCDGSMQCACRLYIGADGTVGINDISGFALSIFKVLCVASPVDWLQSGMSPQELCDVLSSEVLARKGLPPSARFNINDRSSLPVPETAKRGGGWATFLRCFREHGLQVVLELLSEFADQDGGVSLPAFLGCMQALLEANETMKLKVSLKQLYELLDENQLGTVPFKHLATRGAPPRLFKDVRVLKHIKAAGFIDGLNATACNGRVSWISFLRYMFSLANARPLTRESRAAVAMAKRLFDIYDKEQHREVDLRSLASGLATVTEAIALMENTAVEESKICAPERADEGLPSVMSRRGRGHVAIETSDEQQVESPISGTLERARRDTGLCNTSVVCSFKVLQKSLNDRGRLTRTAVHGCVRRLRSIVHNEAHQGDLEKKKGHRIVGGAKSYTPAAEDVVNRLFDAIDVRNVGDVDIHELASALSVLCGGTREEKMLAIFNLFHPGQGGKITVQDIATYTTSVFRVMFKLQPNLETEVGNTPEALGSVTASNMMQDVSPNGDGRISPRDFGWWLFNGVGAEGFAHDPARLDSPGNTRAGDENAQSHGDVAQSRISAGQANTPGLWGDMVAHARKLLCLDCFDVNGLTEMLAEVAIGGTLALGDFWRCIGYVLQLGGTALGSFEWDEAFLLTERIHRAFQDDDGVAAFAAIACGTSILCQSSVEDKILVAFTLFDTDGDEMLALEEVTVYLASMLRVVCAVGHDVTAVTDPDELGSALASQCFKQAQLPVHEKLGMD